jgi:FkbM family methyltransferase
MYSQNHEDNIIQIYLKNAYADRWAKRKEAGHEFTLLDIGANDGKTFSNSLYLIEEGFKAVLVEPSPKAFKLLKKQHKGNKSVVMHNFGFGLFNGTQLFYESGGYKDGDDVALYSSLDEEEIKRWEDTVKFEEVEAEFRTWVDFRNEYKETYDFISIDCEGFDLTLLKQMDLNKLECKCLIIEWNGIEAVANEITEYCKQFGMIEMHRNLENIILKKAI